MSSLKLFKLWESAQMGGDVIDSYTILPKLRLPICSSVTCDDPGYVLVSVYLWSCIVYPYHPQVSTLLSVTTSYSSAPTLPYLKGHRINVLYLASSNLAANEPKFPVNSYFLLRKKQFNESSVGIKCCVHFNAGCKDDKILLLERILNRW